MGLFDRFKKKATQQEEAPMQEERLENTPEMLAVKLLFAEKPVIDRGRILELLKNRSIHAEFGGGDNALMFSFPDVMVHFTDAAIPAQCSILIPGEGDDAIGIPQEGYQQNWHWPEAAEVVDLCKFEILVTNMMSRALDYKQQFEVFMNFVASVTEATQPRAIYSPGAQKIIQPEAAINFNGEHYLTVLANVRLYNLTDREEMLMDSVGLSQFGLPDLQCVFRSYDANTIAGLLWNYLYYIFESGDIIESGNTLQGVEPGSKWKCIRSISLVGPERVVLDIASE